MIDDLQAIKRIFIDYPKMYEIKLNELKKADEERQDLLHVLELGNLDAIKMSKVMRDLKQVSIKRRQIKNNLEILDVIKRFAYRRIKDKEINELIDRVDHITNRERKYTMRVREDLQELVE